MKNLSPIEPSSTTCHQPRKAKSLSAHLSGRLWKIVSRQSSKKSIETNHTADSLSRDNSSSSLSPSSLAPPAINNECLILIPSAEEEEVEQMRFDASLLETENNNVTTPFSATESKCQTEVIEAVTFRSNSQKGISSAGSSRSLNSQEHTGTEKRKSRRRSNDHAADLELPLEGNDNLAIDLAPPETEAPVSVADKTAAPAARPKNHARPRHHSTSTTPSKHISTLGIPARCLPRQSSVPMMNCSRASFSLTETRDNLSTSLHSRSGRPYTYMDLLLSDYEKMVANDFE